MKSLLARDLIESTPTIQFVSSSFQMLNEELAGTLVLDKPIHSPITPNGTSASGDHDSRLAALSSGSFLFIILIRICVLLNQDLEQVKWK
jgi:hypothetical protein